jgi:hypothetical protein
MLYSGGDSWSRALLIVVKGSFRDNLESDFRDGGVVWLKNHLWLGQESCCQAFWIVALR